MGPAMTEAEAKEAGVDLSGTLTVCLDEVDQVLEEFEELASVYGLMEPAKLYDKVTEIRSRRKAVDLEAQPTNVKVGDFISIGGTVYMVGELNPQVGIPDVAVLVLEKIPEEESEDAPR